MLQGWRGDRDHPEFVRLVESIRSMLGAPESRPPVVRRPGSERPPLLKWTKTAIGVGMLLLVAIALIVMRSPGETPTSKTESTAERSRPERAQREPPAAAADAAHPNVIKGAYAISIGDRIEDGVPAAGA